MGAITTQKSSSLVENGVVSNLRARLPPALHLPCFRAPACRPVEVTPLYEVVREPDPPHDLYLNGHQLDGKPVMPIAAVIELLAEVASQGRPELEVVGLRDIHAPTGIALDDGPMTVRVAAQPAGHTLARRGWR